MGTWAEGNFDNDEAQDYLGDLIDQFTETINETLDDEHRSRLDEEGEAVIMPSVELIALLAERYHMAPPELATIHDWRDRYLAIYDAQIDELDPQGDYKTKRRKTIEKTFQWLVGLAESF